MKIIYFILIIVAVVLCMVSIVKLHIIQRRRKRAKDLKKFFMEKWDQEQYEIDIKAATKMQFEIGLLERINDVN